MTLDLMGERICIVHEVVIAVCAMHGQTCRQLTWILGWLGR